MNIKEQLEKHAEICREEVQKGKHRPEYTGPKLRGADLWCANLTRANLEGADLVGADLVGADLVGADLFRANLERADLRGADLLRADLRGADLYGANLLRASLRGADLEGATMTDGRTFEEYKKDPLAGICDEPEARERAIAAWGKHTWDDCPMHEAHGWKRIDDAPKEKRRLIAAFIALFDAGLLPKPESK